MTDMDEYDQHIDTSSATESYRSERHARDAMPVAGQLAAALGILVIVFGISYIPSDTNRSESAAEEAPNPQLHARAGGEARDEPIAHDAFSDVVLGARAAYVLDLRTGDVLYERNAYTRLPLASLTKLMTALVAHESLAPDDQVTITVEAIMQEGDSGFSDGDRFSLRALADLTLLTSSNDGAYALAAAAGAALAPTHDPVAHFISRMNEKAVEIGMADSIFLNATGLDLDETTSGGYGTARDAARLMEYIVQRHPYILEETREASSAIYSHAGALFHATNTNETASDISGLIASKTGYTDLAGGNLVIAFDIGLNRPVVVAILGSTRAGRFEDAGTLLRRAHEHIIMQH